MMSTDRDALVKPVADRLLAGERYQSTGDGRRYGTRGSLLVHTQGLRRGSRATSKTTEAVANWI